MKVKCRVCYGSKKRLGMGSIVKDCDICDKTGWIEKEVEEIVPQLDIYETVEDKEVELATEVVETTEMLKEFAEELKSDETCNPFEVAQDTEKFIDDFSPKKKGRPKKS